MTKFLLAAVLICVAAPAEAQRRPAAAVTLAIAVADPDGQAVPDVLVTLEGAARRSVRTEGGRIALENLPAGNYRLRFEKDGFVTLERELAARGAKPIEVKVTLTRLPPPPPPPAAPVEPPPPVVDAKAQIVDVPALIEKEWVGRGPTKTTALSCGTDGSANVIQLTEALGPHEHADTDETFYVIAGEGNALVATSTHRLKAGMFLFIPRGMRHALAPAGKNPLIVLATRAEGC